MINAILYEVATTFCEEWQGLHRLPRISVSILLGSVWRGVMLRPPLRERTSLGVAVGVEAGVIVMPRALCARL